ncbi:MAG: trypsin-like peptidase domain-containing protein [Anaerolineae bacterium]
MNDRVSYQTRSRRQAVIAVALVLLVAGLGCRLSSLVLEPLEQVNTPPARTQVPRTQVPPPPTQTQAAQPTPTQASAPPDAEAPVVPLPVAPLPDEGVASNVLEAQVIAVYETVGPAVVNITNRRVAYDRFMQPFPQQGSGSGFVIDRQGHIVTNYHVVEGADELLANLANGQEYEAVLVGSDPVNDLAVIRIDAGADLPEPMVLADSDALRVGQFVVAIGNPFGLEQTLTTGVISALGRIIQSPEDNRFIGEAIQTDAAINPGNSGGPLLDLSGRVIGVNSQIISSSGASAGIGFAVSANTVRRVVPELIARGYYPHPWMGTYMLTLTAASAEAFREAGMDLPVDTGLYVLEVVRGGPAEQAGMRGGSRLVRFDQVQVPLDGDVIVAVEGQPIRDFQDLTVYLETRTVVGQTVSVTVLRDGQEQTFQVTLAERPQ